jgi:hypothetical protein
MAAGLGFKDFVTGEVLTAADVDGYLMQGIWVFASAAARDAAVTSPQEGNFAYLKDTNVTTYYTGSAWANLDTTGLTNPMTTTGDIIYSSPGSTPVRLGIGTAGQVLQVNSGATAPEWASAAGGGGMTLISEQTASASSSITFSSISGSYKQLMLIWSGIYVSALGNVFSLRFNNDSSTNYAVFSGKIGDSPLATAASGSAAGSNGATDATDTVTLSNGPFGYNTTNSTLYPKESQGMLLIDNYTSTSKYKAYELDWSHFYDGSTTGVWTKIKGVYKTTTAITSLDIFRQTGSGTFSNNTNTSIRLYGIS